MNLNKNLKRMNIDKVFKSNAVYVIYIFCAMSMLSQCNSCSHNKENQRIRKELNALHLEVDSITKELSNALVTEEEMVDIIKETPITGNRGALRVHEDWILNPTVVS